MVRRVGATLLVLPLLLLPALVSAPPSSAANVPPQFLETTVISGLTEPTAVQFANDGRVFVAEKSGIIKVFDGLSDPSPTVFADLRTKVHNFWDRGLSGLALAPNFPVSPFVYVSYTHDAAIGGTAPRWGSPDVTSDPCPTPPGPTEEGCVVSGRVSRLRAEGNAMIGAEQVLVEGWCQQFPSHSMDNLAFGPDGALYVTAGEGAGFTFRDWGQAGNPRNPCGDPPGGVGGVQTPPSAEGGSLRAQDLQTRSDPVGLSGSLLRLDPATGAARPDNPMASDPDLNARRIVAYGFRNPFRFAFRPGTSEVWVGDVGENNYEEIDRILSPIDAKVENFGWPCTEGPAHHAGWDASNMNLCEQLYPTPGAAKLPWYSYRHGEEVAPGDPCPDGTGSISGLAFYAGGDYPPEYDGALFFSDYSRRCIWVMFKGANGRPNPATVTPFFTGMARAVHLQIGPAGDLFFVNFLAGKIHRVEYVANDPPVADIQASATSGPAPLTVSFDGGLSSDPEGQALTYAWDLDGDGAFDDSTAVQPTVTYASGIYTVRLRVTDAGGAATTTSTVITVDNDYPRVVIDAPTPSTLWSVGDQISFLGHATDAQQSGNLPPSALSWNLVLHHCLTLEECHSHPLQSYPGVAGGQFVAPDHDYPSFLELELTATDNTGLRGTASVQIDPKAVDLTFTSNPSGLTLVAGDDALATPFTQTVIAKSRVSITAPTPTDIGPDRYEFVSWSDGGAASHLATAGTTSSTLTATYRLLPNAPPVVSAGPDSTVPIRGYFVLHGSAQDPEGGGVEYLWEQVAGPATPILGPTTATPIGTAPAGPTTLTYRLTGTDPRGESVSDTVNVTVADSAAPSTLTLTRGVRWAGDVSSLAADDNNYYIAGADSTFPQKVTNVETTLTNISNATVGMDLTFRGKSTVPATQVLYVWHWPSGTWTQVDSRPVGTVESGLTVAVPEPIADYVSGTSGPGTVRVRVRTFHPAQVFVSSADLLRVQLR